MSAPSEITLRPARTADVPAIRALVAPLAERRVLLQKEAVVFYEAIQEFVVAEDAHGELAGFGALHVMWQDIAEVRTLAVADHMRGTGVGHRVLEALLGRARRLGVERVFCLTFEVEFFQRHGFEVMADQSAVDPEVYTELLRSPDEGVAEFLDLARVKPNTLGNTRMIRSL
ncbi:amino-acid N-acetyltransferase [Micrococcus sp.]|uniref:amino-acid N-acetyltransferase n=1 Tax=Micrococcus sp. TaxID=1271 RepID=UPI002A913177|nr:amino-acid N-acetyltransferase [Micrococcus sp.]MDY6056039.1 amino-acid N-acetyltransferase [Micrococcus sp.]